MKEQPITLNINSMVTVRLTLHGKAVRQQYRDQFAGIPMVMNSFQDTTEERMPLWELMYIYGPTMYMGAPGGPAFESNSVTITPCSL